MQSHDQSYVICHTALLPLFLESAHAVAMIKYSFHVIKSAIEHLNHQLLTFTMA